jgi:quinohemoprotein ethanol dehydrogenase
MTTAAYGCYSDSGHGEQQRSEHESAEFPGEHMHALSTRRRLAGCLALVVLLTGGCSREATRSAEPSENSPATGPVGSLPTTPPVTNTDRIAANADPDQWLSHGGSYAEQRFARLEQINDGNVGRLGLAWSFDFDTHRGQESTPLMVDGRLYVSSAWSKVFALDAATGKELWRFDPQVPGKAGINACCDVVNRGVAFYEGKVFVGTIDGRLIALNADTGMPVWSTMTVDPAKPYTITGAPRAAKGKVFIGNGGAEYGVRGYVSAYDADTGALAWRFYTTPSDPQLPPDGAASDKILKELAAPTWHGRSWLGYGGGGGTVWDAIVYDAELDQLYIGTGNGSPWNRHIRSEGKGDNLFLSSVVALDPDTGAYRWHYQETPGETWDYTATQPIILATLAVAGEQRPVLMHAPKNGFFYVLDRRDGKLLSAEKFVPANWAERIDLETGRPVEMADARFTDRPFLSTVGGAGAHNWQPMSYSPQTGLVYIPAQQIAFVYSQEEKFAYRPGEWNLGVNLTQDPLPTDAEARSAIKQGLQGRLLAWDPVRQKEAWRPLEWRDVGYRRQPGVSGSLGPDISGLPRARRAAALVVPHAERDPDGPHQLRREWRAVRGGNSGERRRITPDATLLRRSAGRAERTRARLQTGRQSSTTGL